MKNLAIILISGLMLFTACKSTTSSPDAVLKSFFEKLTRNDLEGAQKLATSESSTIFALLKTAMNLKNINKDSVGETLFEELGNLAYGNPAINGNEAVVPVTLTDKKNNQSKTFDFILKKNSSDWKVDFTMATLVKMGLQSEGKSDTEIKEATEEINKALKELPTNEALKKELEQVNKTLKEELAEPVKQLKETIEKNVEKK